MRRALRALGLIVLGAVYVPVLVELARVWSTDPYAGHGMFVPIFSALVIWLERDRLRGLTPRPTGAGVGAIAIALALLAVGTWAQSLIVKALAVVVAVAGLVLATKGWTHLGRLGFPIGFLVLMIPLPRPLVDAVTLDLQRFAAGFAAAALRVLDIPVYQSGVLLEMPQIALEVAEICNGLRFLMALVVLTIAFARVTQRGMIRQTVLVLSAIPVAILANAVRVATIAIGVHYFGPAAATGAIHHAIGKGVWALTLVPLVVLGLLLRRTERPTRGETTSRVVPAVDAQEKIA